MKKEPRGPKSSVGRQIPSKSSPAGASSSKRVREPSGNSFSQPKKRQNSASEAPRGGRLTKCSSATQVSAGASDSHNLSLESPPELAADDYSQALLELSSQSLEISIVNLIRYQEQSTRDFSFNEQGKRLFLAASLNFLSEVVVETVNPMSPAPYRSGTIAVGVQKFQPSKEANQNS